MEFIENFKNYSIKCLKNYVGFSGRARRSEFWYFTLFCVAVGIVAALLDNIFGFGSRSTVTMFEAGSSFEYSYSPGVFGSLASLGLFLPGLAVSFRRLHDIGKSGAWVLINLIPFVGTIIFIYFAAKDSHPGENQYGANPKEITTL